MLKHILGSKMGKANSLSRRPDWEVGVEKDNEDQRLVKPEWLEVRKTVTNFIWTITPGILDRFQRSK